MAARASEEEVDDRRMIDDFAYYAGKALKIQTMGGKKVQFELNEVQRVLLDIIADIEKSGRLVRILVLKARREGVSTLVTGRNYWRTSTEFNRYAMVITHEPEATDFLFSMVKRYHSSCPAEWKPADRYNNRKVLEFNGAKGAPGLDSAIRVGTAGKEDFGSGQLVHYLHLSEVAKWPANTASDLLTSILQTVPDEPGTEVIFESTARGIGGEFYSRYWSARHSYEVFRDPSGEVKFRLNINESAPPENEYSSVFIPWFVFSKYTMNVPPEFTRTQAEEELVALYGLTDGQLVWRRYTIENKCDGKLQLFQQEYPSNAREAFIASGHNVFDLNAVDLMRIGAPAPKKRMEVQTGAKTLFEKADGRLRVWEEPVPGAPYVIGADVAEGLMHGDFSCAVVINQLTGQQVAEWHGHIAPDLFAEILLTLGKVYNNAWLVPERNNHGIIVVTRLMDAKYHKTWSEKQIEPPNIVRRRFGWQTSRKSKPLLIDNLVKEVRENTHGIVSAALFEEMLSFVQHPNGTLGAQEGMYDDRVMAYAIAKYARGRLPFPRRASSKRSSPDTAGSYKHSRTRPNPDAWH